MTLPQLAIIGVVQEGSTSWVTVTFYDRDGVAQVPVTADYRIDDRTSDTEILDWTPLTPGSSIEIVITAAQNAFLDQNNEEEVREVSVRATTGPGGAYSLNGSTFYKIANLRYVP